MEHANPAQQQSTATVVLFCFLQALRRNLEDVQARATPAARAKIFSELWQYLSAHIPDLADACKGFAHQMPARDGARGRSGLMDRLWPSFFRTERDPARSPIELLLHLDNAGLRKLAGTVAAANGANVAKAFSMLAGVGADAAGKKAVIFLTVGFPTTWAPLARELTKIGLSTFAVCLYDFKNSGETGVLDTTHIPVKKAVVIDFLGHLLILAASAPSVVLLNSDSYYGANWEAERVALTYLLTEAMLAGARASESGRGTLVALKYDALQQIFKFDDPPMDRDPTNMLVSDFYGRHMAQFDRIVYNANSEIMSEFNRNSIPLDVPHLHFYRYSNRPERSSPRIDWRGGQNIHLVILSSFLGDFCSATRDGYADVVRGAIGQGIHIHYYCDVGSPAVEAFVESLPTDKHEHFHLHAIVKDQQALIEQIQSYHVGLVLSDDAAFLRSIATLTDQFYRDATSALWQSTIGSSPFAFAAAGVPFIIPRYMRGVQEVFGADIAMPLTLAELRHMRPFLESCGLERRMAAAYAKRDKIWMEENIARFTGFLSIGETSLSAD